MVFLKKDYYKILGIDEDASQAEVKKAYRAMARKLHPDANQDDPDASKKFLELKEAFDVLSDPLKRDEYDYGPQSSEPTPPSPSPSSHNYNVLTMCPYCGARFNFPNTPRHCPYCYRQIQM